MKRRGHSRLLWVLSAILSLEARGELRAEPTHDVTLTDCLQIAIDHNPTLRGASEQFLAAQGQSIKLHAILYPTVNAQGLTAPTTLFVQINQILYNRAVFPQLRISRLAQDQAVINYRQTLDTVIFQVRQAFAAALGSRKSDELLRKFISGQATAMSSARQLFQAGKIDRSALLSEQVTQNSYAQSQVSSQLSVAQAMFALDNLLGEELPPGTRPVGNLDAAIPADLNQEDLIAEALRNRADLKLLESVQLTQQQQILVDLQNAFPTLGASSNSAFAPPALGPISNFDLERNYDEPEIQRQEGNSQLPLSVYVTWLVFDGGTRTGQGVSDRAQIETQDVAIAALKHSIPGEVMAALAAVETERETLRTLDALTPIRDVQHSAELDYETGRIRQLDLVNLQGDVLSREETRLASQLRLSLALAALDHALGRGLLTKPAATPPSSP